MSTKAKAPNGKLGVMVVGLGAVSSTFITGVLMTRKGLAKPVGSMTQYDKIRVGKGENKKYLHYKDIVPLADLNDIEFAAWDVYPANAYESAINAEVLKEKDINPVRDELEKIKPMPAAFDRNYAKRLDGDNVKQCRDRWDMAEQIREDIRRFKKESGVERVVVLWAASTEVYVPVDEKVHGSLAALEAAMKADDREHVAPSMCYAYAALSEGAPFIMGAPNTTVDIPAMWELADKTGMPIAGKDFIKDPGLHRTMLGDGLSCCLAAFLGGAPITTYSEVTGAVSLTKVTDPSVLRISAISAVVLSIIGKVGAVIQTIPQAVLGGIMLLLFGTIASVGISNMIQAKLDMSSTRNLVIVSLILTIGIGGAVLDFGSFSLSGIGLASLVGVILNLVLPADKEPKSE